MAEYFHLFLFVNGNTLQEPLQGESANEQGVRIEESWKESWMGGQQTCPLYNNIY